VGPGGANNQGGIRKGVRGVGQAFLPSMLIGKIGKDGKEFAVGDSYDAEASAEGKLYLRIMPSQWGTESAGGFKVKVTHR